MPRRRNAVAAKVEVEEVKPASVVRRGRGRPRKLAIVEAVAELEGPPAPKRRVRAKKPTVIEAIIETPAVETSLVLSPPTIAELPTAFPTFRTHALLVLKLRDEQGVRGLTRELSRFRCHILTAAFIDLPINEIESTHIREWLRWLAQQDAHLWKGQEPRKIAPPTVNRCMSLVSVIFADAVERNIIKINPCMGVKPKKVVGERDTIDPWAFHPRAEQIAIWNCDKLPVHVRLTMAFAWSVGARAGEQFNARITDLVVDGPDPHFNIRLSNPHKGRDAPPKSGKRRKVALMDEGLDIARQWLAFLPTFAPENPLGLLFPSPRGKRRWQGKPLGSGWDTRKVYELAGITHRPHLCWHSLRHSFATNLITGVFGRYWRLEEIQVLMGHSSIGITQRYAHLGEDAIKQAVREANAASSSEQRTFRLWVLRLVSALRFWMSGAKREKPGGRLIPLIPMKALPPKHEVRDAA